jgi:hypothetical protein
LFLGLALSLGCAASKPVVQTSWLPEASGWVLRDAESAEALDWVVYERDALVADVKEFRIVGVIDAPPERVAQALRHRLLDDAYIPAGVEREILSTSETEILLYGRMAAPFPRKDREATERITFSHDPETGVFRVESKEVDPGSAPEDGVLRIPVARNVFVIEPLGDGQSVLTNDSVHDIGGRFPNRLVYGAVCDQLVEDLVTLRMLSDAP